MPYPNEHSARLKEPTEFKEKPDWAKGGGKFRRAPDGTIYGKIKVPATADVIWGQLKEQAGKAASPQSIRFPIKNWTAAQARKWLKDNKVKYIKFEPAAPKKGKENAAERIEDKKYHCECIKCGHEMDSDKHCSELKCPKCGGQMRRKERPGPGQSSFSDTESCSPEELEAIKTNWTLCLDFLTVARQKAEAEGITVTEAMRKVKREQSELFKNYMENL